MAHLRDTDRLIDAAERVFKDAGYGQARMEDVAAGVGLQKASLYRHVESKAALLFLVLRRDLERRTGRLVAILADESSARARLEMAIREHLEADLGDLELRDLAWSTRRTLQERDLEALREMEDHYAHLFRRIVQDAVDAGVARADLDLSVMTRYLVGMLNLPHAWFRPGRLDKTDVIEMGVVMALGALGVQAAPLSREAPAHARIPAP